MKTVLLDQTLFLRSPLKVSKILYVLTNIDKSVTQWEHCD